jgi:penicillin-binding protein 2
MLIALAALQEGLITANSTILCRGGYQIGDRTVRCHSACGHINVRTAIKTSCNTFFCELAVRLGMERFEKYGSMFNFGRRTQIDLPFEARGRLPTREWLLQRDNTRRNFTGMLANYGIGQGEILATPLQMAAYTAAIANGGTFFQPHLVKSVYNQITGRIEDLHFDSKQIPIDSRHFNTIKDGMWAVVNAGGTGRGIAIAGLDICGKTGTAQNPHGKSHSWFVAFAPRDNPQIAICVMIENAGYGSVIAAPIAKRIFHEFFFPGVPFRPTVTNNDVIEVVAFEEEYFDIFDFDEE